MVTVYPAQIDNTTSLPLVIDGQTSLSASYFNSIRSSIIAIEQALGVNPTATYGTVGAGLIAIHNEIGNATISLSTKDIGGSYSSPLVVGIQGYPISTNAPQPANVLTWNGLAWVPLPAQGGANAFVASGDLGGNSVAQTVIGIQGKPISNSVPTHGTALVFDGTQYSPTGIQPVFNVLNYGADPTGVTDSTAAFNSAFSAVSNSSLNNAIVYVPAGTYLISSPLSIPANTTFKGNGRNSTIIKQTVSGQECIQITDATEVTVQDMSIQSAGGADAIHVKSINNGNMEHPTLERLWITNFGSGGKAITVNTSTSTINCTSHGFSNGQFVQFTALVAAANYVNPTFNASGNTVTINNHGLSTNDPVQFNDSLNAGVLPTGVSSRTTYYVINPTVNTFQIATAPNGSAVTFTGSGTALANVYVWGVAPGGLQSYFEYYVVNATTNTFQVSSTNGGSPITLTAAPTSTCHVAAVYAGMHFEAAGNDMYSPRIRDCLVDGITLNDYNARTGILLESSQSIHQVVHATIMGGEFANLKRGITLRTGAELYAVSSHIYNCTDGSGGGLAIYTSASYGLQAENLRFEVPSIDRVVVFAVGSFASKLCGVKGFQTYQIIDNGSANSYEVGIDSNVINRDAGAYTFDYLYQDNLYEKTAGHGVSIANKLVTTNGRRINLTSITSSYTMQSTDDLVAIGTLTTAITITLPASPITGDMYTIKDTMGSATAHNITISGNGKTIDGSLSPIILNTNYQSARLFFNGTGWNIW